MIDISSYASKILSVEEYYIDKRTNKISIYNGYSSDLECKHSEGPIHIEASLYSDDRGPRYDVTIKHRAKKGLKDQDGKDVSGKKFTLNFDARNVLSFAAFRDHIDGMLEKSLDRSSPFDYKCFRYEESNNKTEDDFTVTVFACGNDIDITVAKDKKIAVTKYNAVVSDELHTDEHYTFFNNGYRLTEYEEYNPVAISDMIFHESGDPNPFTKVRGDKGGHYIVYYDELVNGILNLPDLGRLPNIVANTQLDAKGEDTTIEYTYHIFRDEDGLVKELKNAEDDCMEPFCLYEKEDAENGKFVSSLTYRCYDSSFLGVISHYIFELNQIDYDYDDRKIKYTRSTFEVNNPKEFEEAIVSIKSANPDIVIIKQLEIPEEK